MDYDKILKLLEDEYCYARENFIPIIRDESAKFLYDFVRRNKIKTVLEIGTAIGYSGNIILSAGAERLVTVDINEKSLNVAMFAFEKTGYIDRVNVIKEDAMRVIVELVERGERFDMIFLDGPKGQYINYLPYLTKLIGREGVIFADNVLLGGMVESNEKIPHRKRTMVNNLRKYLNIVNNEPYDTELFRIEDGVAITRYKGE